MHFLRVHCANFATIAFAFALALAAHAQQSMGTIDTHDATLSGGLEVHGDRARLLTNATITALDHTAAIQLDRGGEVLVCSTTDFHLLHSGSNASLLFGLDRGAIELHGPTQPQDVVLTPDIRFTLETAGTLDLRLRVTRNGDTCVDNAGASAPVLLLNDPFTAASYRLMPGQHVLFEHGSLREVVDHERAPCGCPAPAQPVHLSAKSTPAQRAAAAHPFPAAISEGLAPPTPADNTAPVGEAGTQVSTTFTYGTGQQPPPSTIDPTAPVETASTEPPPAPPGAHAILHSVGHFFHKLFHPHS
jgi:hypothetical protein